MKIIYYRPFTRFELAGNDQVLIRFKLPDSPIGVINRIDQAGRVWTTIGLTPKLTPLKLAFSLPYILKHSEISYDRGETWDVAGIEV